MCAERTGLMAVPRIRQTSARIYNRAPTSFGISRARGTALTTTRFVKWGHAQQIHRRRQLWRTYGVMAALAHQRFNDSG